MKRECKTCKHAKYVEGNFVMGYRCTLSNKMIDGYWPADATNGFREKDFEKNRILLYHKFQKRNGYKYWCPLIKHRK